MKIILHGYTGRMGHMVQELLKGSEENTIVAKVAADAGKEASCYQSLNDFTGEADVVIDFSQSDQLDLALYVLDGIFAYSDMFLDDGDDLQYRRLLLVRNNLERAIFSLRSINPDDLKLG